MRVGSGVLVGMGVVWACSEGAGVKVMVGVSVGVLDGSGV